MDNLWKLDDTGMALLAKMDKIVTDIIGPSAHQNDKEAIYPTAALDAMREAGLLGLVSSEESGGHGQSIRTAMAFVERIARVDPSTAMVVMMHYSGAAVIDQYGNPELKKEIGQNGKLTTLSLSESGSRSHFWIPVSKARKENGSVIFNGGKQMTTSAGKVDYYVWSSTPAEAEGLSSMWAVPGDTPGLTIPAPYDGLGLRSNNSSPIKAVEATIPSANQLGEDGGGFDIMMGTVLPIFSFQNAAVSLGTMEGAFAAAVKHVSSASFSYDNSSLRDIPQVRNHVAKMKVKIDMVRGLLLMGLDSVENNKEDAMLQVLQSKVAAAEASLEVHDIAMRVSGGAAFRKDVGVERYFRDSRAFSVMAPVSDALYDFIGKAVTGMDVF